MGARLDAAKAATDELMGLAETYLTAAEPTQGMVEALVTKARAARAALEMVRDVEDGTTPAPVEKPEPEDFGTAALIQPGSPVPYRTDPPKPRERGGPRDPDQGPGVFKKEFEPGASQIQRGMRPCCAECGRLLDIVREDPCPLPDCPHPGPIRPAVA